MVPEKPRICTGEGQYSTRAQFWQKRVVALHNPFHRSSSPASRIEVCYWSLEEYQSPRLGPHTAFSSPHLHDVSYLHLQSSRLSQNASCSYRPAGLSLQTTATCNYRTDRAVLAITNLAKNCLASIQPRLYYCVHSSRIYLW